MRVKLLSANLRTGYSPGNTKPDRRFKTGVRIISEPYMTYSLTLRVTNPLGRFRLGDRVRTQYGNFQVNMLNSLTTDGEINLISVFAVEKGDNFEFTPELDILYMASWAAESSSIPVKRDI